MLYMSCLPCNDSKECTISAETKISSPADHQQHNHSKEACTPFCTCTCCAASVFFSPLSKIYASNVIGQSVKHSLYNVAFKTEVYYTIWQPPKIS